MKNRIFYPFVFNASLIFTILSLFINSFFEILFIGAENTLPNMGVNFITYIVSMVLSAIISTIIVVICYKHKKQYFPKKMMLLYYASNIYTFLFLSINLSTLALKNIWNIWTILLLFVLSFAVSIVHYFVKIKSFLLKSTIYFILFGIVYFIITLYFGNYGHGHKLLIVIAIYLLSFAFISTVLYLINKVLYNNENANKKYDKIFK